MAESGYLNFDLEIERAGQDYSVQVLSSPAGEVRAAIVASALTQIDSAATPQAVGEQLFEAIFRDEIRGCLRRSLDEAQRQQKGLRIRLRLADAPELTNLPWEYLYDRSRDTFFALSSETPLVRYLDLPEPPRDLQGEPKLRVLAVIASPAGYPPLDVEREWANLKTALHDLEARGLVAIDRLTPPSIEALQRQLLRQEYHILHFLGHGSFDAEAGDSVLLLQDEAGQPQVVTGQTLQHPAARSSLLAAGAPERLPGRGVCCGRRVLRRRAAPRARRHPRGHRDADGHQRQGGHRPRQQLLRRAGRRRRRGHRAGRVAQGALHRRLSDRVGYPRPLHAVCHG